VTWSVTGSLDDDSIPAEPATSLTFAPSTAGTSGTIVADDGAGHSDATGLITVNEPPAYLVFLPLATRGQ
jgi:hypothetical protein